jgi:hypothetical protein
MAREEKADRGGNPGRVFVRAGARRSTGVGMDIIAVHITFDLRGRLPIARTPAEWERICRTFSRVLAPWNPLGWSIVYDHAHVLVAVSREEAGRAAHAIECAVGWWRRGRDTPRRTTWNPPRFKAVLDRRELADKVPYVLRNGAVASASDILAWRWSSAWETLGLRVGAGGMATGFEATHPGFVAGIVVGRSSWRPEPAARLDTPAEPVAELARIAAAALGFTPDPREMNRMQRAAWRTVAIGLAVHRGWAAGPAGAAVGLGAKQARRIVAAWATNPGFEAALRLLGVVRAAGDIERILPPMPPDPVPAGTRRPASATTLIRPAPPSRARPSR